MPIPDERLPELDETEDDVDDAATFPDARDESDELEFESSDADSDDDAMLDPDEEEDTAGFGFGDPSD